MNAFIADLPLALFTTLLPLSAGGFLGLAIAFGSGSFEKVTLKRIDRKSWILTVLGIVSLISATCHLGDPLHGLQVFSHIGSSPLSNEVAISILFVILALVYTIMGLTESLKYRRNSFAGVIAFVGLVACIFAGLAYMLACVPGWNTPLIPLEMIGFYLLGGVVSASVVMAAGNATIKEVATPTCKRILGILAIIGFVLAVGAAIMHAFTVTGYATAVVLGTELVSNVMMFLVAGVVLLALGTISTVRLYSAKFTLSTTVRAAAEVALGILFLRLAFYGMYLSVGVTLL